MTEQLIDRNSSLVELDVEAPGGATLDRAWPVVIDNSALDACMAALQADSSTAQRLRVESVDDHCYVVIDVVEHPRQVVIEGWVRRAAFAAVTEIGSVAKGSPSGYDLSGRCILILGDRAGGNYRGWLLFGSHS